jgi:Uma2 family endonuclease
VSTAKLPAIAALIAGQQLPQATFHERYLAMPPGARFELIGGVVVMPSPVGDRHSTFQYNAIGWLWHYSARTPGVLGGDNASTALTDESEVQPDAFLRISPDRGGQTHQLGNIIGGAPELVIEVANSSRAIDLGAKLAEYERAGTREYIVLAIDPDEVFWYTLQNGRLFRVVPDPDGIYRSTTFPGLWLNPAALIANDVSAMVATLDRGLATVEHAAFVAKLATAKP